MCFCQSVSIQDIQLNADVQSATSSTFVGLRDSESILDVHLNPWSIANLNLLWTPGSVCDCVTLRGNWNSRFSSLKYRKVNSWWSDKNPVSRLTRVRSTRLTLTIYQIRKPKYPPAKAYYRKIWKAHRIRTQHEANAKTQKRGKC